MRRVQVRALRAQNIIRTVPVSSRVQVYEVQGSSAQVSGLKCSGLGVQVSMIQGSSEQGVGVRCSGYGFQVSRALGSGVQISRVPGSRCNYSAFGFQVFSVQGLSAHAPKTSSEPFRAQCSESRVQVFRVQGPSVQGSGYKCPGFRVQVFWVQLTVQGAGGKRSYSGSMCAGFRFGHYGPKT